MDSPGTTPYGASTPDQGTPWGSGRGDPEQGHWSWPMIVTVAVLVGALLAATTLALAIAIGRGGSSTPPGAEGTPEAAEDGTLAESHPEGDVSIFLCDGQVCPEITDEQFASLEASLSGDGRVRAMHYESSAEAYERFLELFADQPHLTGGVDEATLPPSFRVWLHDPADADDLAARFADHLGVEEVIVSVGTSSSRLGSTAPEVDEAWLREGIGSVPAMRIELCDGLRCPEASDADRAAIEAALDRHPLVTDAVYRSRADAYEHLWGLFDDHPQLLEHVTPDLMPEVYDVYVVDHEAWLDDPELFHELVADLHHLDGIEWLTDGMGEVRDLLQR